MRVLFWYCTRFDWVPASKTLEDAPAAVAAQNANVVVAFVHVEPGDPEPNSSAETKLVKNAKWLARKWDTRQVVLHSFTPPLSFPVNRLPMTVSHWYAPPP